MNFARWITAVLLLVPALTLEAGEEIRILSDFEQDSDLKPWYFDKWEGGQKAQYTPALSDQHATHGAKSVQLAPKSRMKFERLPKDWSGFDNMRMDIFVDGEDTVTASLLLADADWAKNGNQYWDRHNSNYTLHPGPNTLTVLINGLYRGEKSSRYAHLKYPIKPGELERFDLNFEPQGPNVKAIYVDYMRLVKEPHAPDGVLAFNFAPEQELYPGFATISWNTVYGQNGCKAGLKNNAGQARFARNDTFPTPLYQTCVEMGENSFIADMPDGKYHVWLMYDDLGFWGYEMCKCRRRSIEDQDGKELWAEERGEKGLTDYLFLFENVEPHPSDSAWDMYTQQLFQSKTFNAEAKGGHMWLRFKSDNNSRRSHNVAAMVIYPDKLKDTGGKFVAAVEARNKEEFDLRAVCLGPKPKELQVPAEAAANGFWLGFPALEENVTFYDPPGKSEAKLSRVAARDMLLSFTFAVRPLKDFSGPVKLVSSDLTGPAGKIPASEVDLRFVQHCQHRAYDIAYTIGPETLHHLEGSNLKLAKDLTRQFIAIVHVPADAKGGVYKGELNLASGELNFKVPYEVEVLELPLDDPDFIYGFFGFGVPGELPAERQKRAIRELFKILKDAGMNSFTGGPNVKFDGFDANGKPKLDFTACDEFLKTAREYGFTKAIQSYGGPAMIEGLHDGYTIGATGEKWAAQLNKPFPEVLKIVWTAWKEHAEQAGWQRIDIGLNDEPRVLEPALETLKLHKAYAEGAPFVRTGGYYSINWQDHSPLHTAIQDMFKALVWSGLNCHSQTDLDKGKEFKREVFIYNQGITRYSFGAYQWAEMHKGVRGRAQWHQLALHGYQFFDLDGREPDTATLNWGRDEIIPTIHFRRCSEGAFDFKFAVTLWNLAEKNKDNPAAKAAQAWLEEVSRKIGVDQTGDPKSADPYGIGATETSAGATNDEAFRNNCAAHIKKLMAH